MRQRRTSLAEARHSDTRMSARELLSSAHLPSHRKFARGHVPYRGVTGCRTEPGEGPATAALRLVGSWMTSTRGVATMADTKRMTAEEVVGYLLEGEGRDVLRESLCWVCEQLMEAEV